MQPCPDPLAGFPRHLAEALAGVLQRHHEQERLLVFAILRKRWRALAVVDLRFLARGKLQHVEPLRVLLLQAGDKPFNGVVLMAEAMTIDELAINTRRIAPKPDLIFDPHPVRFTRRHRSLMNRWPPCGSFSKTTRRPGGHPEGV